MSVCVKKLVGKTLTGIERDDESLSFITDEGDEYVLYHEQDCCEHVYIEDICGDLEDLIGSPILQAELVSCEPGEPDDEHESLTWSFYKFATIKGYVTVRWLGSSNGYYSEAVDFKQNGFRLYEKDGEVIEDFKVVALDALKLGLPYAETLLATFGLSGAFENQHLQDMAVRMIEHLYIQKRGLDTSFATEYSNEKHNIEKVSEIVHRAGEKYDLYYRVGSKYECMTQNGSNGYEIIRLHFFRDNQDKTSKII